MANKFVTEVFEKHSADSYDERNKKLSPIMENLHLLTNFVLQGLPENAHLMSLGAGTGLEIAAFAKAHPAWTFAAVEPAGPMLEGARARLKAQGFSNRTTFFHGYLDDFPREEKFDAVVSLLVMHFVPKDERAKMYGDIASRLKPGGKLIVAEISADLNERAFPELMKDWLAMHHSTGISRDAAENMLKQFREQLPILSARETEALIEGAGFEVAVPFFQSIFIKAWHSTLAKSIGS